MRAATDELRKIRYTGGASRLDLSLDLANERIYNAAYGMRTNAFKVYSVSILILVRGKLSSKNHLHLELEHEKAYHYCCMKMNIFLRI